MSDVSKLNSLKPAPAADNAANAQDKKLRQVAELYERHFIREMMKQMRATVQESGFLKQNNAEKIFRDQLDDQYADEWGKAGGIGLSTLIYDQLLEKLGPQLGLKKTLEKPQGPLEINPKTQFAGLTQSPVKAPTSEILPPRKITQDELFSEIKDEIQLKNSKEPVTFKFQSPEDEKLELRNPWVGVLLDKKHLEMDQIQYRIKHDNGLESLILTRGTGLGPEQKLSPGDTIQAGQQLGWMGSASPLFWTVKTNVSE